MHFQALVLTIYDLLYMWIEFWIKSVHHIMQSYTQSPVENTAYAG